MRGIYVVRVVVTKNGVPEENCRRKRESLDSRGTDGAAGVCLLRYESIAGGSFAVKILTFSKNLCTISKETGVLSLDG